MDISRILSLEARMVLPDTMEAPPQGRGSQVSPPQEHLGPVSEVRGVFSNRDNSSISGRWPRAAGIGCVQGFSWTVLDNYSKEDFSCLVSGFLLGEL